MISIASASLVSPAGLGLVEHAFFGRASVSLPAPQAFETEGGERVQALHCGFLGAALPMAERLSRLAEIAAHQALAPWEVFEPECRFGLLFVAPRRAGVDDACVEPLRAALVKRCRAPAIQVLSGAAGAFAALGIAERWLADGTAHAALIVAVDSMISTEALTEERRCAPSDFAPLPLPASEGAAAVLVVRHEDARARRVEGPRVLAAAIATGQGSDADDEIVDGLALTSLLRALPNKAFSLVVGQSYVDDLRTRDFQLAAARVARRFTDDVTNETVERLTGRLGAAAGVAQLAHGTALMRHGTVRGVRPDATCLAWAIGAEGLRGVALLEGT